MLKGNVIVGQSGGPTAVINSSLGGVFKAAKSLGAEKVFGMRNGVEGLLMDRYIDLEDYIKSDLDIELLKRTPSSFLGSCRFRLPEPALGNEIYVKIFDVIEKLNVKHFFYIGGNDSMDTIMKLSHYAKMANSDVTFIGIPKTIDNDLVATDHTPGYGSAAKYIASALKEIIRDSKTYETDSVTIVEIMGRNAGWLTAAAALSKAEDCSGPDLIYLPEIEFDVDKFLKKVKELKKDRTALVIAVSEGIKTADGKYVCDQYISGDSEDSFGHIMLGGTALTLANLVASELKIKTRGIEFSTLQRCASHLVSRQDITEAYNAGEEAVRAADKGETGKMIVFERISQNPYILKTTAHDIESIANLEKKVPLEWITEDGTGISDEFIKYASPLIIGELSPFMVDGLPRHLFIEK